MRRAAFLLVLFGVLPACEAPTSAPAPAASASNAAPVAASPADRAAQCQAVLSVVARAADESKAITGKISGDGTKQLEALAGSAKQAKSDVEKVVVTDAGLAAARDRYAAMLGGMSTAAAGVVAAAREQEFEKLDAANTALTKAVDSEPALVDAIQRACATQ